MKPIQIIAIGFVGWWIGMLLGRSKLSDDTKNVIQMVVAGIQVGVFLAL